MSENSSDKDFEPDFYAGMFGCLFGASLLPIFTIWLCSVAAPQISHLDKEALVKGLACINGAMLGGCTGSALARLKNNAYEAGSTAYRLGFLTFMVNTTPWLLPYLDGQNQPVKPGKVESLSLQSWVAGYSLAALWAIMLIIWGTTLMRNNKPDKSD